MCDRLTYKHNSFLSLLSCNRHPFFGLLCGHSHPLFRFRQTLHKHIHLGQATVERKTTAAVSQYHCCHCAATWELDVITMHACQDLTWLISIYGSFISAYPCRPLTDMSILHVLVKEDGTASRGWSLQLQRCHQSVVKTVRSLMRSLPFSHPRQRMKYSVAKRFQWNG